MPTLGELMSKFASESGTEEVLTGVIPENKTAVEDGQTKTASGGNGMKSLTDIYLGLSEMDKVASAVARAPEPTVDDVDFAKLANAIAEEEANEVVQDTGSIVKVAAEYDSAGRIMARGFYDEFQKLAGALDTDVSDNQMTESESEASTPALGSRGLPTMETNFAGSDDHDEMIETAGPGPGQVYADSLKPTKTISAGDGTGDDPEGAAIGLGGGSPAGFATVRDLQA